MNTALPPAYLDIETAFDGAITVIGVYRPDQGCIQLVDGGVHDLNVHRAVEGIGTIYTYNGAAFDLPYIKRRLGVDLRADYAHHDLMRTCLRQGLRGGLKKVEQQIGIVRTTAGLTGYDAPKLWRAYQNNDAQEALALLLRYNREDVVNLPRIRAHLEQILEEPLNETVQVWMR